MSFRIRPKKIPTAVAARCSTSPCDAVILLLEILGKGETENVLMRSSVNIIGPCLNERPIRKRFLESNLFGHGLTTCSFSFFFFF